MSRKRPRFGLINDGKREEYSSVSGVAVQWQSLDERKMEKSRKADSSRDNKGKRGESRVGDHFPESMQQHAACYVVESSVFLEERHGTGL